MISHGAEVRGRPLEEPKEPSAIELENFKNKAKISYTNTVHTLATSSFL